MGGKNVKAKYWYDRSFSNDAFDLICVSVCSAIVYS